MLAWGSGESTGPWELRAPTLGWVGLNAQGSMVGTMVYDWNPGSRYPPPGCAGFEDTGLSYADWDILKGGLDDATVDCGVLLSHFEMPFKPLVAMRSDGTMPGSPEPFGSQLVTQPKIEFWTSPWNWSGMRTGVAQEIENQPDRYPMLRLWEAHQDEPENYPDPRVPRTEQENHHRCDLSSPALQNPGGSDNPDPFAERIPTPFPTLGRPAGALDAPDPYLRWGHTFWGGDYLDNWPGCGWRHIQAKHGWGPDDELATRSTLQAPAVTVESGDGVMRYTGPQYELNGAVCQRWVIVEYNVESVSGKPYGIRTSYGRYIRDAT